MPKILCSSRSEHDLIQIQIAIISIIWSSMITRVGAHERVGNLQGKSRLLRHKIHQAYSLGGVGIVVHKAGENPLQIKRVEDMYLTKQ